MPGWPVILENLPVDNFRIFRQNFSVARNSPRRDSLLPDNPGNLRVSGNVEIKHRFSAVFRRYPVVICVTVVQIVILRTASL